MERGKVKWYNQIKGFGFIETEQGEDIFVHRTGLSSTFVEIQPEEEVEYEIKKNQKGFYAVNVKKFN